MNKIWKENIDSFIHLANLHGVKMIMIGGGAVNFHGYQRHSADVDFWIDTQEENLQKLVIVFRDMGFYLEDFPKDVKEEKQNISVKFSPEDLNLELITKFHISKSFDQALADSEEVSIQKEKVMKWNVLQLSDLLESKERAARPKDLLDIQQLKEIHKLD